MSEPKPRFRDIIASRKMLVILALGAASGFPNQITESALQAWFKDAHISNTSIGLLSYVAIPYLLKPLWAPLLDRFPLPFLGRRRGWMMVIQFALALSIAALALQNPAVSLSAVAITAIRPSAPGEPSSSRKGTSTDWLSDTGGALT